MKTKLLSVIFLMTIYGLNTVAQTPKMIICDLSKVSKTETINLSSLVDNCTPIQFEDSDEALFKAWFTTASNKYIGVSQSGDGNSPYKLFDRSGKFLGNVGAVGNGPGEYAISIYDAVIDDKKGLVYLAPFVGKNILVYNVSGKFVKNIESPERFMKPKIHLSDNGTLTLIQMPYAKSKSFAIQFDSNGKVIKTLAPPANLVVKDADEEIFNTRNVSSFNFLHTNCDTLLQYSITQNKVLPVFTMKVSESDKGFKQYFDLNSKFIATHCKKGLVFTDRVTGSSSIVKVVNDFYGNLGVPVNVTTFRNGWFVQNMEPEKLKEQIEKRLKESNCTAQDKQKLNKLLSSINEEANNVLFIGKLK